MCSINWICSQSRSVVLWGSFYCQQNLRKSERCVSTLFFFHCCCGIPHSCSFFSSILYGWWNLSLTFKKNQRFSGYIYILSISTSVLLPPYPTCTAGTPAGHSVCQDTARNCRGKNGLDGLHLAGTKPFQHFWGEFGCTSLGSTRNLQIIWKLHFLVDLSLKTLCETSIEMVKLCLNKPWATCSRGPD